VTDYDYGKLLGIDIDQVHERFKEFYRSEYHDNANPIFTAPEVLSKIHNLGHELHIISARDMSMLDKAKIWLNKHIPNIPFNLHFTGSFFDNKKSETKSQVCERLNIKTMIDDALHNAEDLASNGIKVYLFDRPWNRKDIPENVERVYDWDEIFDRIK
jgi:uncharacterized HAD superfamily protein